MMNSSRKVQCLKAVVGNATASVICLLCFIMVASTVTVWCLYVCHYVCDYMWSLW